MFNRIAPWEFDKLGAGLDADEQEIEDAWKNIFNLAKDMDSFIVKLVSQRTAS
jgi:hypothetical protein